MSSSIKEENKIVRFGRGEPAHLRAFPSSAFGACLIFLFLTLLFIPPVFAQQTWANSGLIQYITGSKLSPPLMAALICVLAMAIILMAAVALGSEELKQFVRAELGQAIVTVLIVICIVALVSGLDIALESVAGGITSPCVGVSVPASLNSGLTTNKYAYCYVDNLYGLSKQAARDSLRQGVDYASQAYLSTGVMTTRWFLLYIGFSIRPNADKRLDSEVKSQEFYLHETYMISLLGQRYVLQTAAPAVGSAALFLGVLLRALFYTRRLGGLLMAAGLALLLVWPATYLLAWVTLNVAVFGPQAISTPPDSTCPASCLIQPPYGYKTSNAGGASMGQDTLDANQIEAIASAASLSSRDVEGMLKQGVQPCYPAPGTPPIGTAPPEKTGSINYADSDKCPSSCRFYPTPADCDAAACASLPRACKTIRAISLSDPADVCTGGIGFSGPNSGWQCTEAQCPAFCKQLLPQVKEENGKVVASKDADLCGKDSDCQACTLFLRRYNYGGDASAITAVAKGNPSCEACMGKYKDLNPSAGGPLPDCMTGVPTLLSGTCDASGACGTHMGIGQWLTAGQPAGVCPVDCRINFKSGQDAYKDPLYVQYCEGNADIVSACRACPVQCKVNSSALGAGGDSSRSGIAGLSGPITCAEAPKFINSMIDPAETAMCRLCPMSCRFSNLEQDANTEPFLSLAHYPLACNYYPDAAPVCDGLSICTVKLTYSKPSNPADCPANWFKLSGSSYSSNCPTLPDPPTCAPTTQAYQLASEISDSKCPPFIVQSPQFVNGPISLVCEPPPGQPGTPGYMLASVQPNTDASAECASPTAQKYCEPGYCPDSCKADRQTDGPFYCSLSDVTDKNALILDNSERCPACATLGSGNSLGPQCEVMLLYEPEQKVLLPQGCDASKCAIGSVDENGVISEPLPGIDPTVNPQPACNGFCFPRLPIPTFSECAAYVADRSDGTTGPNNLPQFSRSFAGGASCPLRCRYDYQNKRPTSGMAVCGDGFEPKACGNCEYALDDGEKAICENDQHYNDCSVQKKPEGHWWFKTLDDIVPYNENCPPSGNCEQYEQSMISQGYTETNGPIYACTALHKYPQLDSLLGGNYRECGDVGIGGANPALNLCQPPESPYSSSKPLPAACSAKYDATTVACQPLISSPEPPAPDHCLNCPLFCRSIVNGGTICSPREGRGNGGWDRGGSEPICGDGASETCDMRISNAPANTPSFLPGFCGVDSSAFNIPPCQLPNEGYGALCPARCRVLLGEDTSLLPAECQTPEIADACNVSTNLPIYCRAAPPTRLCQGCIDCQTDCIALPLVRQNCQELCLPSDIAMTGRTDLSPNSLISAMGGAAGNTDWRNLGNEAIAVFILPIFCILITLSFIRALSPFLGGDIELPGILKLI
ncbi:MAG: hypothetical protein M1530_02965 [Candidatus Marsarchaeota archaeon]|nr:hypothetical protein [Candidatus Marsarchaeota archaeon]